MKRAIAVLALSLLIVVAFSTTAVLVHGIAKTRGPPDSAVPRAGAAPTVDDQSTGLSDPISRVMGTIRPFIEEFVTSSQRIVLVVFQFLKFHVENLLQNTDIDPLTDTSKQSPVTTPSSVPEPQSTPVESEQLPNASPLPEVPSVEPQILPPESPSSSETQLQPETGPGEENALQVMGVSWNHDPLIVAIVIDSGVDTSYRNDVLTALIEWEGMLKSASGTSRQFEFQIIENQRLADIVVRITDYLRGPGLGVTDVRTFYGTIISARVTISTASEFGKLSHTDVRNIARHEIGHALGLAHTEYSDTDDLMNPTYDSVRTDNELQPSKCDVDAIFAVYDMDGFGGVNHSIDRYEC